MLVMLSLVVVVVVVLVRLAFEVAGVRLYVFIVSRRRISGFPRWTSTLLLLG